MKQKEEKDAAIAAALELGVEESQAFKFTNQAQILAINMGATAEQALQIENEFQGGALCNIIYAFPEGMRREGGVISFAIEQALKFNTALHVKALNYLLSGLVLTASDATDVIERVVADTMELGEDELDVLKCLGDFSLECSNTATAPQLQNETGAPMDVNSTNEEVVTSGLPALPSHLDQSSCS